MVSVILLIKHVINITHSDLCPRRLLVLSSHRAFQQDNIVLLICISKQWNNDLSCVFSCSWVRTLSTVPSCWMSATRRLWRTQSTTASSLAMWTWSQWTTATSTTATTSRDTLPSPWTNLVSGERIHFKLQSDFRGSILLLAFTFYKSRLEFSLFEYNMVYCVCKRLISQV